MGHCGFVDPSKWHMFAIMPAGGCMPEVIAVIIVSVGGSVLVVTAAITDW